MRRDRSGSERDSETGVLEPRARELPLDPVLYNLNPIPCQTGNKYIELYLGDVTLLSCDLLIVSAFKDDYRPVKGTVFGSLFERYGLVFRPEDLEEIVPGRVLLSSLLSGYPFGRVLIAHLRAHGERPGGSSVPKMLDAIGQALGLLAARKIPVAAVAMPFLGAGDQGHDHGEVISAMLNWLPPILRGNAVNDAKIAIFTRNAMEACNRVFLHRFQRELDATLQSSLTEAIRSELDEISESQHPLRSEARRMRDLLMRPDVEYRTIAQESRILCETFCNRHFTRPKRQKRSIDLFKKIEYIQNKQNHPPNWYIHYLHILRVVGNAADHPSERLQFDRITAQDMQIVLLAVVRLLRYEGEEPTKTAETESGAP